MPAILLGLANGSTRGGGCYNNAVNRTFGATIVHRFELPVGAIGPRYRARCAWTALFRKSWSSAFRRRAKPWRAHWL